MAITRAQQAKQMLQDGGMLVKPRSDGKRPGYAVDTGDFGTEAANVAANESARAGGDPGFSPPNDPRPTGPVDTGDFGSEIQNVAAVLDANRFRGNKGKSIFIPTPFNLVKNLLSKGDFKNKFVDASNLRSRTNFLNKIGYGGQFTPEFIKSDLGLQTLRNLGYTTMQDRLDNTEDDDDSTPLFPRLGIMAQAPEEKKEEDEDPPKYFDRLLAEGGRAGFQEGGIMPRLNQLGSGVSSAEQMLQGINQRLESAESTLGGGGGLRVPEGNIPTDTSAFDNVFMGNMSPGSVDDFKPLGGTFDGKQFDSVKSAYDYAVKSAADTRAGGMLGRVVLPGEMGFEGFSDLFNRLNDPNAQQPIASLSGQRISGIPAAGYADGGNVVGGEYDFESARQMYGLGKLVKKITKSVKKIAKSPLGKVAIGAALFHFGKPLVKSEGFKNFFLKDAAKGFSLANLSTKGALTGIAGISALGGLTAEEDDEEQLYAGADFPNPVDFYLSGQAPINTRLAAEGGLMRAGYQEGSKEPVAKKTMPLLDMGGMEKDYREEGGFVPIGRMEKADDVPARLSKNEFVFTADAVRNAGDGDVDLGAEKMYNMMKNLEAGGDVSEESQGLKGAREMFQTSQRLEEVL